MVHRRRSEVAMTEATELLLEALDATGETTETTAF
jgi:hypothetical protein